MAKIFVKCIVKVKANIVKVFAKLNMNLMTLAKTFAVSHISKTKFNINYIKHT